ncbi:RAD55 family ATPase [Microvirga puerhi]|uniref:non-specific serine/threonine protein kinase n=1 Tax=Microvirga puerhi TaxID=2876078 RepID=A0ABS7VMN6_9HYPH|nr:ATPase domain-containing protein [Microvirga puerhi]MBZ6076754.1 serine/threonine protein phosphatase [Microvirga puerhi]
MSDWRIEKLSTGIEGLDTILEGGVLRGGIYIVQGTPGAGKTILGNQLCFNHAARGGRALYVTLLAETHGRMLAHIGQLGFFDEAAIPDGVSYLSAFRILETEGLKGLTEALRREIRARDVNLLILDGLVSAEETAGTPREFKKFIHELQIQADLADCTMVLLTSAAADQGFASAEHTMVDGLIELRSRLRERRSERDLLVHKMRGGGFLRGVHSFQVTDAGITVQPRIESLLATPSQPPAVDGPMLSTGIPMLDDMLGGGLHRHSATLIMGPAGSGKSTVGHHFLGAQDEPGLFLSFDEDPESIRFKARHLSLPVASLYENEQVEILWQPSTEGIFDEVCLRLIKCVRARGVKRIFIDGLNDFVQMTGEQNRIGPALTALTNEFRALGATMLGTFELDFNGIVPGQPLTGLPILGVSPIAENIVVMRFAALGADIHRLMVVLKARDNAIRPAFRYYDITASGIDIDRDSVRADRILHELIRTGGAASASSGIAPFAPDQPSGGGT